MSAAVPANTYAAGTTYGASYAAPSYGASYAPPMSGYGQMPPTASPYMDASTITKQETEATTALNGQADMQLKMIGHQYSTQKEMIEAECTRNIAMAKNQFE